jgi:hypothetical protein
MLRREALAERRQLCLRVLAGHPARDAPEDRDRGATARLHAGDIGAQRQPQLVRSGERVSFRHHTDDRREAVPELHAASDDLRVGVEAIRPQVVAEQHHGRSARTFVRFVEYATEQGTLGRDPERGRRDLRRNCGPRALVRTHKVDAGVAVGAHVGDRPHGPPQLVVVQHAILFLERLRIPVLDLDDAIAVRQRQFRARQDVVHLEGDGTEPDAERHREATDDREAGILHEHSEAKLQVERQSAEPRGTATMAQCLAMLLHSAEGDERAPPRLDRVELSLAHEALRLHLEVEANLLVDSGLGGTRGEEAQASAGGMEPRHGMLRE